MKSRTVIEHSSFVTFVTSMAIFFLAFVISMVLLDHYQYGDQLWYHNFYDSLADSSPTDIPRLQLIHTGSAEPVYGMIMWIGSYFSFPKNEYISFFNSILAVTLFVWLREHRAAPLVILLVFTNFYFIVLLTGAERLKFSFIFLLLALSFSGMMRWAFLALAPLAHFQTLIIYSSIAFEKLSKISFSIKSRSYLVILRNTGIILVSVFAIVAFISRFSSAIAEKIQGYYSGFDIISIMDTLLFISIGLIITKNRKQLALAMLPIVPAALVVGQARVTMVGFVILFYLILREGRSNHILMYILLFYFSLKSYGFVENILLFGNGFYRI